MPYPSHYLLQFGGPRGSSNQELWTCGIRMILTGSSPGAFDEQDYLDTVCVPALKTWMGTSATRISTSAKMNFAKLNAIGPDGLYVNPLTVANYFPTPVPGSVVPSGGGLVFQVALAITWETDTVSRGPASKGRIYSPAPVIDVNTTDGLFDTGVALGVANAAKTLLIALKGGGGAGTLVGNIVSDRAGGVAHRIDRVSVDNRLDIIRKRANGLDPVRSTVSVA